MLDSHIFYITAQVLFSSVCLLFHFEISYIASQLDNLPLCHTWSTFTAASHKNPPEVISNISPFHTPHAFPLFFFLVSFSYVPSPYILLSLCLNLLSLMRPSRESQAWKKGRSLTEIDVWALPLIRWLNPSINMQRRCPMQMDPIRQNGVVLSVCCGEW